MDNKKALEAEYKRGEKDMLNRAMLAVSTVILLHLDDSEITGAKLSALLTGMSNCSSTLGGFVLSEKERSNNDLTEGV